MDGFLVSLLLFLIYSTRNASGSACYFDHCQNLTDLTSPSGVGCSMTKVQSGKDCSELNFEDSGYRISQEDSAKFYLSTRVKDFGGTRGKVTAFSLTVINANFKRIITRYRNIENETLSTCAFIELHGNESYPAPTELHVSCPFSHTGHATSNYKLQILVIGDTYEYVKQYLFNVPDHKFLGRDVPINQYTPFAYIDISEPSVPSLNVQLYPKRYNVTQYKIWLINNETGSTSAVYTDVSTNGREKFVTYNFSVASGVYYFKVAAIHPICDSNGCRNSTTPVVHISESSYHLLIMVVSTIWIPPATVYALYRAYKHFKKKGIRKSRKPNCLLVYAPTQLTHISALTELVKYLRACNIHAIIDTLDMSGVTEKGSSVWYRDAFNNARAILVATSPAKDSSTRGGDELLQIFKENCLDKSKRYFTVQFPYCKVEDVPEEARHFKYFHIPDELAVLVKTIHSETCTKYCLPSDKELLNSIKTAETEILRDNTLENTRETDGLLGSEDVTNVPVSNADQS